MKNFNELTKDWSEARKTKAAKRVAELNAELDAFAEYYERTGVKAQYLGPTEQRKIIEEFKENQ
jgi:hypothetical protein